ncbi:MAG: hypothetical protein NZL96_03480 [Patescibacteria group bacterium]|nr:hypothetical protein [Patescibacteria group bacterium]
MRVCPSILEKEVSQYFKKIERLAKYFSWFQLDFTDGKYVRNRTASIDRFLIEVENYHWKIKNLYFDFHLMVNEYSSIIEKLEKTSTFLKIKNVFIHFNLLPDKSLIKKRYHFNVGLVLNPEDKVSVLVKNYDLGKVDILQIMSVKPGRQGNPFIKETLAKIAKLRKINPKIKIFLDGGINDKTIHFILDQKDRPDVICPGSFLSKVKDDYEFSHRVIFLLEKTKSKEILPKL